MKMKVTKEVSDLLESEKGCLKIIALKLCEISEALKPVLITQQKKEDKSLFELIFGKKGGY